MKKCCQIIKYYVKKIPNYQKNKKFPDRILQKSTRSSQEQNGCERSKLNQIEKPTPLSQCGKIQYTVEKNGVKKPWWNINSYDIRMLNHQKNKKFPDQILQKSTRGNWPWSKTHRIKKPTTLWKTKFLRCTTVPFNQKLFVNPEGGNKHFVFSQLR